MATAERIRFGNPHCPKLFPDLAFRSNSWHSTAETITKLAKIDHPKRTIPCKTRRFSPLRRAEKNLAATLSTGQTPPHPGSARPLRKPSEQNRTPEHGTNAEETWNELKNLKKAETPKSTILSKTLEIRADPPAFQREKKILPYPKAQPHGSQIRPVNHAIAALWRAR